MSQQLESRENLRRLAEGQIKEMTIDGTSTANGTARTKHITITYADGDRLVLTKVQRDANVNLPSAVPAITDEENNLGAKILKTQREPNNQTVIQDFLDGKIVSCVSTSRKQENNR